MTPRDRPVQNQEEIEITPQMIEAGIDVLLGWCPDTAIGDETDHRMVRAIYRAMEAANRYGCSPT